MGDRLRLDSKSPVRVVADAVEPRRGGLPGGVRWLVGGVVTLAVLAMWGYEPPEEPPEVFVPPSTVVPTATTWTTYPHWCFNPECVEPVESGEVVRVSTVLGEMEWQRLVGQEFEAEFDALSRSLVESAIPFGGEGVDWGSVGWPLAGWEIEARGHLDPAGLPGLGVGVVDASGVWEPLEVEADVTWDHGVERPIRGYWMTTGPAGVMLVGEPWSSPVAPFGWVMSDEGRFELVGSLPFYPDFVNRWYDGVPMLLPVADGFVGIGGQDPDPGWGEVSQELWWSEDGRAWTLVDERPIGEDGGIGVLAGYGGQWIGLQAGATGAGSTWLWASTDGQVWDRVGESPVRGCWRWGWDSPALLGGERGWIAVECDFSSVWLSVDGIEWQQLPDQDTILGIYPSSDEVSLSEAVWLIGNDRTVLISAGFGWDYDTSVGWVGRFVEDPPSR